jgi:hypothetical protein
MLQKCISINKWSKVVYKKRITVKGGGSVGPFILTTYACVSGRTPLNNFRITTEEEISRDM